MRTSRTPRLPRLALFSLMVLGLAAPAAAQVRRQPAPTSTQTPRTTFRPFFLFTEQRFAAKESFEGIFGSAVQPFIGGGLQVTFRDGGFLDFTASWFHKDGERAFTFDNEVFPLGIPLTSTLIPFEVTAGYRFQNRRRPRKVVPYIGFGAGAYHYSESSGFSDTGDDVSVTHLGFLAMGGAEFRVAKSMALAVDVQVNQVPGILEDTGIGGVVGENNMGGIAARFRILFGK